MKSKRSLFRRLIDKVRRSKSPGAVSAPPAAEGKPQRRRTESSFEPLEGRIAPAILLNATTVQFTDTDGDLVTVKFSKPLLQGAALNELLDSVFKFKDGGTVRTDGLATDVHELAMLDLTQFATLGSTSPASGMNVSITATQQNGSNDTVNVGYIKAATSSVFGIALGKVEVEGDLGQIDAGDRNKPVGIASLTVKSWGALGLSTQITDAPDTSRTSNVTSSIGKITVLGDFIDASLLVVTGSTDTRAPGKIGSITIGGDLKVTAGSTTADAGLISAQFGIGNIDIGNILGGGGTNSAKITTTGKIGNITIDGNLQGGAGKDSGQIVGTKGIGKITIDTIQAGGGEASGRIVSSGNVGAITLQEILAHHNASNGDAGKSAGSIAVTGNIASLTVVGDVSGGKGDNSGSISSGGIIGKISIGGHLTGLVGKSSGQIIAGGGIGSVTIDGQPVENFAGVETTAGTPEVAEKQTVTMGKILGTNTTFTLSYTLPGGQTVTTGPLAGTATGAQIAAAINALTGFEADDVAVTVDSTKIEITFADVGAQAGLFSAQATQSSLTGGTGDTSGAIISNGNIGNITLKNLAGITTAMLGGGGSQSGAISALGNIGVIKITGNVDGSFATAKEGSGGIVAGGNIKALNITGDLKGGVDELTGAVAADGTIKTIKIGGSLVGGAGTSSGSIIAGSKITSATIEGSLDGGTGANSASIVAGNDTTKPGDLVKVTVLGNLLGDGVDSASIRAGGRLITAVLGTITGSTMGNVLSGGAGSGSASLFGGTGIGSVTILGHVAGGEGINSASIQANGLISTVKVSGNLVGGDGVHSGSIQVHDRPLAFDPTPGNLGKIIISGGVVGGDGDDSGQIFADGSIKSVTVGGLTGDEGNRSGSILAGKGNAAFFNEFKTIGGIGSIVVNGAIGAGTGSDSASIQAGGRISALTVNGSVTGAVFETNRDFGAVTINGDVLSSQLSALGSAKATAKADVAIGKLTVNGSVSGTTVLAGYDLFGNATNGNAQIGAVKVTNNWTASSIVAGVQDVETDGFGDADDLVIGTGTISKIASIVIGGAITGTDTVDDHFGFVAQTIASVTIGGIKQTLTPAKDMIDLAGSPVTNDTSIREVA
jgi:hypothetical protein